MSVANLPSVTAIRRQELSQTHDPQTTLQFRLSRLLLVLWVAIQSAVMIQTLPPQLSQILFTIKNPLAATVVVIVTLLNLKRIRISSLSIPPLVFCSYVLLNVIIQDFSLDVLLTPLMYFIWAWALFILFPSVFPTRSALVLYLRLAVWSTIVIVAIATVSSYLEGMRIAAVTWGNRLGALRYSFGLRHPGYFGGIAASVLLGSLLLRDLSDNMRERRRWLFVSGIFAFALCLADYRTGYVLVITAILVRWVLSLPRGRSRLLIISLFWFSAAPAMVLGILYLQGIDQPFEFFNYILSARLRVWQSGINAYWGSLPLVLFGNGTLKPLWQSVLRDVSGNIVAVASFANFKIDSTYLQILLLYGLSGLAMFGFIFFRIYALVIRSARHMPTVGHNCRRALRTSAGIITGVLLMQVFGSIMPSLGNLVNAMLLPSAIATINAYLHDEVIQHRGEYLGKTQRSHS